MYLKVIIHLFLYWIFCEAMTMKQIKNSGKMMRKACQPKNNVEDDKVDGIMKGEFLNEINLKCYMACIMKMANMLKNGKINYEQSLKQADMLLPDEIKEETKAALTTCKDAANGYKDICDASFHMTKCIYDANPSIFYFP